MLPYPDGRVRQPVGGPRRVPAGPGGPRRRPRPDRRAARAPTRARWSSPPAGPRPTTWPSPAAGRPGRPATDRRPAVLVCSAMEHHAVLEHCRALARRTGAELREVPTGQGRDRSTSTPWPTACDPEVAWCRSWRSTTRSAPSSPSAAVAAVVRRRSPGRVLHTDAVQAVPWLDVAPLTAPADLVAVSAHKFGGPKGVRRPGGPARSRHPAPVIHGGGQERERRSGTHNVAGIVAMAAALAATVAERDRRRWPGWPPCGTGSVTGCWPRCRGRRDR